MMKPATMGISDGKPADLRSKIPSVLNNSVVVFSTNYLPMARINIRRAIGLLICGRAEPLDLQDSKLVWVLHSPSVTIEVPHHIRLKSTTTERLWKLPSVSRRELLRRDGHRCQYCGSAKQLTIDHVIPRSKGGTHTWDNVTIACETCNHKKGDKYLNETAMVLKTKPKAPMHPTVAFAEQFWHDRHPS
jgi:5-methylcytosine-specific restriction endonuclease McrA